jgi:multiple sugar transport system ATP-binding protein
MTMGTLELRDIDKVYRSRGKPPVHAVRSLNMDIEKGEIVALLGSSGCGKTSTLRMIAGFESVTAGSIALRGRRIDELPPARRKVAMAFEGYSLYPPLTVRQNIGFALKSQQLSRSEVSRRVDAVARLVEIDDILESFRARFPVGSSSESRWRARWCGTPISICSTNPWDSSNRSCGRCCVAGSRTCSQSAR